MTDHVLTIYFDGDEMAPVFKCHAKPSASGQVPPCWTWTDEENDLHVDDHCVATDWIENDTFYYPAREVTLDVEVDWEDEGPQLVVSDPAKRIAELEAELARFKECDGSHVWPHTCTKTIAGKGNAGMMTATRACYHKEGE